jgi:hypothetical protein
VTSVDLWIQGRQKLSCAAADAAAAVESDHLYVHDKTLTM